MREQVNINWITPERGYTDCGRYKVESVGNDYYLVQDHEGRSRRVFTIYAVLSVIDLTLLPGLCQNDSEPMELSD